MKQLLQMGFADRTKNLRFLKKFRGDIQKTIGAICDDSQNGWISA